MSGNYEKKEHAFRTFSRDLKNDDISPVIFMYGPEEYLTEWAVNCIVERFINPAACDLDYIRLSEDSGLSDILEAAGTFSMFSEKRVIWVKDYPPVIWANPKGFGSSEKERLAEYIKDPNQKAVLIFSATEPETKSEIVRELKKSCSTYFFDKLDYPQLSAFAEKRFKAAGVPISRSALRYLIDESGYFNRETEYRILNLENDIKKIIAYTGGKAVTEEDISLNLHGDMDTFVFNFLDAVSTNRKDAAFELLHNILTANGEVFPILGLLINHFELILMVKEFKEDGMGAAAITSKLKMNEFRVKKAMQFADKFTAEKLRNTLSQLYETDRNIKTGLLEQNLALELLVGRI